MKKIILTALLCLTFAQQVVAKTCIVQYPQDEQYLQSSFAHTYLYPPFITLDTKDKQGNIKKYIVSDRELRLIARSRWDRVSDYSSPIYFKPSNIKNEIRLFCR